MSWRRTGNHISIYEAEQIHHIEAVDVYKAIQNHNFVYGTEEQGDIEEVLPEICFSPISSSASIRLDFADGHIFCNVNVENVSVDFLEGRIVDQVIINDVWHYIDNAEEVSSILSSQNINENGEITPAQYVSLVRLGLDESLIVNAVDTDKMKSSLDYNAPAGLNADLYPYQKTGYSWMHYMIENCGGCILGDEMGLGKTLQAISLIQQEKNDGNVCLVIAPVSLLENWYDECRKFAPFLHVLIHHGPKRTGSLKGFNGFDLIVTSYSNAVTDNLLFCQRRWGLIVLDEAQNIKNPKSKRTLCIKDIPASARLAVTGTPFENHMKDIWSITDFILPGYLGDEKTFERNISDDIRGARLIEPVLSSIMVRRLVKNVAQDLPEKIDIPQALSMTESEANDYEEARRKIEETGMTTLPEIQKLRMYCTHPELYEGMPEDDPTRVSIKYMRCCEILEEIFEYEEKAIVFTSYQKMFDIFKRDIPTRFHVFLDCINGTTPVEKRQGIVNEFNSLKGSAILILNPKAAGTGLNITAANHVIHYNLEWNPAVEDQASARAYRRGQTKTTFIYRLYYKGTVEEIINERIEKKRSMAGAAVVGNNGNEADLQDMLRAIKVSPKEVRENE